MKKFFLLLFIFLFLSINGTGSEDVIESAVPGSVSLFLRTEAAGNFVSDLKTVLSALPEAQTAGFRRAAGSFGMDSFSPEDLKKAGIDLKRRAGIGFSPLMKIFVMIPVTDPGRTFDCFVQSVLKMDSEGKMDLFPVPGKYREVPVTQMGKDIFFFSMQGYFFICSASDGVKEIIDSVLDKKPVLFERTDYRKFLMNSCSREDFVSLFADRSMLSELLSWQPDKGELSPEYLAAGIRLVRGRLSFFAGTDFSPAEPGSETVFSSGNDLSSVFRTGEAGRALFSPDMSSCLFLSLDRKELIDYLDLMPEIRKLVDEQELELKKKTGLSLKNEVIPECRGTVSIFMKQEQQDYGIFIPMKKDDSGMELYGRIKSFLKKQGRVTEDPVLLKDEQGGEYVSFSEKGMFSAGSQEMLGQMMECEDQNSAAEKFLKKNLSDVWGFWWVSGKQMDEGKQTDDFLLLLKKQGFFVFAEAEMNLNSRTVKGTDSGR